MSELDYQCLSFQLRPYYLNAALFHLVGLSIVFTGFLVCGLPSVNRR